MFAERQMNSLHKGMKEAARSCPPPRNAEGFTSRVDAKETERLWLRLLTFVMSCFFDPPSEVPLWSQRRLTLVRHDEDGTTTAKLKVFTQSG